LHSTQLQILLRALQLCKKGGRVVYSTCSFNPLENEAVVAQVLRQAQGSIALVDVGAVLPQLQRRPGLSRWAVPCGRAGKLLWEPIKGQAGSSSFAPSKAEAQWMCLDRCVRIYPHLQDTGGFFVALLEKTGRSDADASEPAPEWNSQGPKDAFVWYSAFGHHPGWSAVRKRYNLPQSLASQFLVRNGDPNTVHFVNKSLAALLVQDEQKTLFHANSGLGVIAFQAGKSGQYLMTHTGLQALLPFLSKPISIPCSSADMRQVLEGLRQDRHVDRAALSAKLQRSLDEAGLGGAALVPTQGGVDAVAVVVKQKAVRLLASETEVLRLLEMQGDGGVKSPTGQTPQQGDASPESQQLPPSDVKHKLAGTKKQKKRKRQEGLAQQQTDMTEAACEQVDHLEFELPSWTEENGLPDGEASSPPVAQKKRKTQK